MKKSNIERTDIILVQPPGWAGQNPPLGLALLKSSLSAKGFNAKAMDLNINMYNLRHGRYRDAWEPSNGYYTWERESYVRGMFEYYSHEVLDYIHNVLSLNPKVIGLSTHCSSFISAKILADKFRQFSPETKIIFGGPQVASYTRDWNKLLASNTMDAVVFGEGEESLAEYIRSLDLSDKGAISGVAYKDEHGRIINGEPRELIEPLDSIPFADFSDFDLRLYIGRDVLPTYFSRGCINKCIYCTENQYFPRFRNRTGQRVFDEIVHQLKLYPSTEYFRMHDSVSNGNIKELEKLCDLLLENRIKIGFGLENATVRKEMDPRLYAKLKKAGCAIIGYGLENPSKSLLRAAGKNACLDADLDKVVEDGANAKITIGINMMFGLPGETKEDHDAQLDFIRRHSRTRKYMLINPALNFCYFPEGCAVSRDPGKYNVDMSMGELYWSEKGGTNTFPERLEKFEDFCELAEKLGYKNLFNITHSINKNEMLGKYYYKRKEYAKALEYLNRSFRVETRTMELVKDILGIYEESGLPKDGMYKELVDYMSGINTAGHSWLDNMTTRAELDSFISERKPAKFVSRLEGFLENAPVCTLRPSAGSLKKYVKCVLSRPIENADNKHIVVNILAKDIDPGSLAHFMALPPAPKLQASLKSLARYAAFVFSGAGRSYDRSYSLIKQKLDNKAAI